VQLGARAGVFHYPPRIGLRWWHNPNWNAPAYTAYDIDDNIAPPEELAPYAIPQAGPFIPWAPVPRPVPQPEVQNYAWNNTAPDFYTKLMKKKTQVKTGKTVPPNPIAAKSKS
jgi:hypothetical protein